MKKFLETLVSRTRKNVKAAYLPSVNSPHIRD
uniref:Uncharacterized protein n=1 Tax=Anguilla anguilla TaxID=7936 RepID=A0A0E9UDT6_ANGAN